MHQNVHISSERNRNSNDGRIRQTFTHLKYIYFGENPSAKLDCVTFSLTRKGKKGWGLGLGPRQTKLSSVILIDNAF